MRINARTGNLPLGPPGLRRMALLGVVALLAGACADDSTAMTDTADATTTTSGTTEAPPTTVTPTTDDIPTTGMPTTTESLTSTTTTTGPTTSTDPTTTIDPTDSTTTTTTTTATDTDTDTTDTDTTTGDEVVGRSVTQTVNSGTVATSPNFRMVFTMGQPTSNQGIYTSSNFRLQGGLIGANGNPP